MSQHSINDPHDRVFKQSMSDKRVAIDFFQRYLPEKIQKLINFDRLKICKETYIDERLKQSAADVLYSTVFDSQPGYLYVIVEAQTSIDRLMPFRILRYTINIMQHHLKQYHTDQLPIVYPMVFYTGKRTYSGPIHIFELFGRHGALAEAIVFKAFQLIDINKISDEELKQHPWAGTFAYFCKHIWARDILKYIKNWTPQIIKILREEGDEYLASVLEYIFNKGESAEIRQIAKLLTEQVSPQLGERAMTIAEQLRQEGMQRGLEQGLEQGKQRTTHEFIRKMLQAGLSLTIIANITGLSESEISRIVAEGVH